MKMVFIGKTTTYNKTVTKAMRLHGESIAFVL